LAQKLVLALALLGVLPEGINCQPPPNNFKYVRTDESPASVLYDDRNLHFFVSVPDNDEIEVVSALDGSVVSTIKVARPNGLDLSLDGTRLYVTSLVAEGFFLVDTTSLQVVDFIQPTIPGNPSPYVAQNFPLPLTILNLIAAMGNGKTFYTANQRNTTAASLFAFDPSTGLSRDRLPPGEFLEGGRLRKSLDGGRFVWWRDSSGDVWVYDSSSDSYTAHRDFTELCNDAVISPNGTRILVNGHLLLDQNLNQIADLKPAVWLGSYQGAVFSPDNSRIYIAGPYGPVPDYTMSPLVTVFDSASGAFLGGIPAPEFPYMEMRSIAVSSQGTVVVIDNHGFFELNASQLNPNLTGATPSVFHTYNRWLIPPVGLSDQPSTTLIEGTPFQGGTSVFFGTTPAINLSDASQILRPQIRVQPPATALSGPVDLTLAFPDGWVAYLPEGYTYGPVITNQDVSAGDAGGGSTVLLLGFGFNDLDPLTVSNGGRSPMEVMVGGNSGKVTVKAASCAPSDYVYPLQCVSFQTPAGTLGMADITVANGYGNFTLKNGFRYVSHRKIPGVIPVAMALDELRGVLYAADAATGDVKSIDLQTLEVRTLLSGGGGPANGLAITPDGNQLLVLSGQMGTLTVVDLNHGVDLKTFSLVVGNQPPTRWSNAIVGTARGTALVNLLERPPTAIYEVNLQTGEATGVNVPLTSSDDTMLLTGSSDGTVVYIGDFSSSGGEIGAWHSNIDAIAYQAFKFDYLSELSTTGSGDRVLADTSIYTENLSVVTARALDDLLSVKRELVLGQQLHRTGSLEYRPTSKGVEVYDAHHGNLVLSVGVAGGVLDSVDGVSEFAALVVDKTGTSLYMAEADGLGIVTLDRAPLSIGTVTPDAGDASGGNTVTLLGTGFAPGAVVTIDGKPAETQIVDTTKLTFVVPPISAKKVAITIANPGGEYYTLSASYDTSVLAPSPKPSIDTVSVTVQSVGTYVVVNGSGFVADSQVTLQGVPVRTLYMNSGQLIALVYTTTVGPQDIAVVNPGGSPLPPPSINSVNPSPVPAVNQNQTITINGIGFQSGTGSKVRLTSSSGSQTDLTGTAVTWLSSTQLSITVNLGTVAGNWAVQVFNPDGTSSNIFSFSVAAPPAVTSFALPQLAFGGGWYTALYFSNPTAAPVSAVVNFITNDGTPLAVPLAGIGTVSFTTLNLNPGTTTILEALNIGDLVQGWAETSLPQGVVGYAVFRQSVPGRADQEAVVPLTPESSQRADLVYDDTALTTSVAFLNPTNQQTTVTITAHDPDGSQIGTSQVTLAARSKQAMILKNMSGLSGVAGQRGWATFSVPNGAVSVLGLRSGTEAFTSIPVAHGTSVSATSALPQLAYGGGWYTALYFANTTGTMLSTNVNFVGNDGTPLSVPIAGIGSVSSQTVILAPGATMILEATNTGDLIQGWAEASLPQGMVGYAVFRQSVSGRADQEAVVPLTPESSQMADLIYDDTSLTTSVAFLNPSSQPTSVSIAAYGQDGSLLGSAQVALGARAKQATILKALPGLSSVAGNRGRVLLSVPNGDVSVLGLRSGTEAFTSIPVNQR
jgi:hypothetical protein